MLLQRGGGESSIISIKYRIFKLNSAHRLLAPLVEMGDYMDVKGAYDKQKKTYKHIKI